LLIINLVYRALKGVFNIFTSYKFLISW